MNLALVLAYIALNLLSPADIFPAIAPFRPLLILGLASLPLTILVSLITPEIGKLRTQFVLVVLFFLYAPASWLPHRWLGGSLAAFFNLAPNIIVYFLAIAHLRTPSRLRFLRATLVLVALFIIGNSFLEISTVQATFQDTPYVMKGDVPGEVRIRGLGMLHDPNTFGQYLLMILPMLFVGKSKNGLGIGYFAAVPVAVLLLIGVYLTGSRGAVLGVIVLIGLFLTRKFKTVGAVVAGGVGSVVLLAVNAVRSRTVSLHGGIDRLAIWSDGLSFFKHSPLWGIGYNEFMDKQGMAAHNSFLLCAAELGIMGFFLWMGIVVVTMIQLSRVPAIVGESNPVLARWAVALKSSLGVYLFTSFFLSRAYELPLFLLIGTSGAIILAAGGDEAIPLKGSNWPVWSLGLCAASLVLIYIMLRLRAA